jgi:hypothetical protein
MDPQGSYICSTLSSSSTNQRTDVDTCLSKDHDAMDSFCRYPKQPSEAVKFCPRRKCISILEHRTSLTELSSVDLLCKQYDCVNRRSGTLPFCQEHIQDHRSRSVAPFFEEADTEASTMPETLEEVFFPENRYRPAASNLSKFTSEPTDRIPYVPGRGFEPNDVPGNDLVW